MKRISFRILGALCIAVSFLLAIQGAGETVSGGFIVLAMTCLVFSSTTKVNKLHEIYSTTNEEETTLLLRAFAALIAIVVVVIIAAAVGIWLLIPMIPKIAIAVLTVVAVWLFFTWIFDEKSMWEAGVMLRQ